MVEIADLDDTARSAGVFSRLSRTDGQPVLSQRVAPEDRADLARFLDRADVKDDDFYDMETWGAALVIASRVRPSGDRQSPDRELIAAAPRVVGLETYEQQFGVFDTLPQAEQADLLIALAHDATGENQRIEEWLRGDLPALERDSAAILDDPELAAALQTGRNRGWAPQIEADAQARPASLRRGRHRAHDGRAVAAHVASESRLHREAGAVAVLCQPIAALLRRGLFSAYRCAA